MKMKEYIEKWERRDNAASFYGKVRFVLENMDKWKSFLRTYLKIGHIL